MRLRGRIEAILDWARVRGYRTGENPARWKGHLDHLLPAHSRVRTVQHWPAMPHAELPRFIARSRAHQGTTARALEFTILTACRTSEVLGARWDEIKASTWTVPAERMKGRLEDRVPLSDSAVAVLEQQARVRANEFVFPGARRRSLHDRAMQALLHRMDVPYSVHGMRSSFRDWSVEVSDAPDWVSEKALAHLVGDETRRAYQRGDLFEKRKELMTTAWAAFCDGPNQCKLRQSEPPSPKSLLKTVACKSFLLDVRQLGGAL